MFSWMSDLSQAHGLESTASIFQISDALVCADTFVQKDLGNLLTFPREGVHWWSVVRPSKRPRGLPGRPLYVQIFIYIHIYTHITIMTLDLNTFHLALRWCSMLEFDGDLCCWCQVKTVPMTASHSGLAVLMAVGIHGTW